MKQKELKEFYLNKYKSIFAYVWHLGDGVMFVKHLAKYLEMEHPQTWEILNELKEANLISVHKWKYQSFIKLKQYPIVKMTGNKNAIVRKTNRKIMRSAYINAILLMQCKNTSPIQYINEYAKLKTNFFASNRTLLSKIAQVYKEHGKSIDRLILEANNIDKNKQMKKDRTLQGQKEGKLDERPESEKIITLDNLIEREIYINGVDIKDNVLQLKVAIVDVENTLKANNTFEKLKFAYDHIIDCFNIDLFNSMELEFNIYVSDQDRKNRIENQRKHIEKRIVSNRISGCFEWNVVNTKICDGELINRKSF